jgi:menaquinone-dependent protoporphyrinogen oxidase
MTVLIAVASRHGATEEIGEAVGKLIHKSGFAVDVVRLTGLPHDRPDPAEYDAVVLGSGVYLGRWLAPAREFVAAHQQALRAMPVWAFSSGPVGHHDGTATDDGAGVAALVATLDPIGYRVFGGKLDPGGLGLAERVLIAMIRAGEEDNRDWDEISSWAGDISRVLRAQPVLSRSHPGPGGY